MHSDKSQKIHKFVFSFLAFLCAIIGTYCFVMSSFRVDTSDELIFKRNLVHWIFLAWSAAFILCRLAFPPREKALPAANLMEQMFGTRGTAILETVIFIFIVYLCCAFIMWSEYSRIVGPKPFNDWWYRFLGL